MKDIISCDTYNRNERILEGNRFLIGNGHLGYRGSLEEENKEEMKGLNLVGVYDKYEDKWRESINMPDPLFLRTFVENSEEDIKTADPLCHNMSLHLEKGYFSRKSSFPNYCISSERFLSFERDNLLASKIEIEAKHSHSFSFHYGLDLNVYEINGPHFKEKNVKELRNCLLFEGVTNEGRHLFEAVSYRVHPLKGNSETTSPHLENRSIYVSNFSLKEGEKVQFEIYSLIFEEEKDFEKEMDKILSLGYEELKNEHTSLFFSLYKNAKVSLKGDPNGEIESNYSIYMLLILGDRNRFRSIPARGVSGQTYKGAIFWDTEIFLLPFFSFQEPAVARNLLKYRIHTLEGAKKKAKEFGYEGAFFAWESQDNGLEACSKYNVTDYKTGKPIRTYFNEKQIHISADIAHAFENYEKITGDSSLLYEGGIELLLEISRFFLSYATFRNGEYHLDDVIGPDEYHERINDNAFTNYMVQHALRYTLRKLEENPSFLDKYSLDKMKIEDFLSNFYLPKENSSGVIEQFEGYFQKEDCSLDEVRSRLKDPKQYWGGKDGPASPTQIIKQADVVAMLVLLSDEFPLAIKKANYDYYFPRTEHGSSLSSSMYSLLATEIGEKEYAYKMFRKSASIDLYGPQKLFAGGVYIGGSHPASEGGAYMSLLYGFSGLKIHGKEINVSNNLPKEIKELKYSIFFQGERYLIDIQENKNTIKKEVSK